MTDEEDDLTAATKALKRAVARAKHAKHQLQRYPASAPCNTYQDAAKQELRQAYNALGALLAERGLLQ